MEVFCLTPDSHIGGFSFTTASLPKPTCPRVEQWSGPKPQGAPEAIYTVQSQHVSRNRQSLWGYMGELPIHPANQFLGEMLYFVLQISQVLHPKWTGQDRSPQGPAILPWLYLLLIPKWRSLLAKQKERWACLLETYAALGVGHG